MSDIDLDHYMSPDLDDVSQSMSMDRFYLECGNVTDRIRDNLYLFGMMASKRIVDCSISIPEDPRTGLLSKRIIFHVEMAPEHWTEYEAFRKWFTEVAPVVLDGQPRTTSGRQLSLTEVQRQKALLTIKELGIEYNIYMFVSNYLGTDYLVEVQHEDRSIGIREN